MNSVPSWLVSVVIIVVLSVWAGAYVVTFFDHSYQPPAGLTEVMMAIGGFVLTSKFIVGNAKKKDQEKRNETPDV